MEVTTKGPKWGNSFWASIYNEAAKKLSVIVNDETTEEQADSSIASSDEKDASKIYVPIRKEIRKIKPLKNNKQA